MFANFDRTWPTSAGFGRSWAKPRLPEQLFDSFWATFAHLRLRPSPGSPGMIISNVWRIARQLRVTLFSSPLRASPRTPASQHKMRLRRIKKRPQHRTGRWEEVGNRLGTRSSSARVSIFGANSGRRPQTPANSGKISTKLGRHRTGVGQIWPKPAELGNNGQTLAKHGRFLRPAPGNCFKHAPMSFCSSNFRVYASSFPRPVRRKLIR